MNKYTYYFDDGDYALHQFHDTQDEAYQAAMADMKDLGHTHFWLCELVPYRFTCPTRNAHEVIYMLADQAGDDDIYRLDGDAVGKIFMTRSSSSITELADLLAAWANKHTDQYYMLGDQALYINGRWMPAGNALETFNFQHRAYIDGAALAIKRGIADRAAEMKTVILGDTDLLPRQYRPGA